MVNPARIQESRRLLARAQLMHKAWNLLVTWSVEHYGDAGPLVSGVYRAHFPLQVRSTLRSVAFTTNVLTDAAYAEWRAGGRRLTTWRREYNITFGGI